MSFLHIQSFQQSTDESSHHQNNKLNFLQISSLDLKQYRKKWRLLFTGLLSPQSLESIYQDLQTKTCQDKENKELVLLQAILLGLQAPLNLKLTNEQWTQISEIMPTQKTPSEWQQISQQFIHQSAYNNPWSESEDKQLLEIILSFQRMRKGNKWSKIAQELNERSQAKYTRTPKQCRERWGNKLDPSINRDDWSDAEDLYFLQLLLQQGRRWAELSVRLSAITNNKKRTEFSLKHRYKKLMSTSNNTESKLTNECKYSISSDWNNKELNKLLLKISHLEKKTKVLEADNFYFMPLTKQVKLNSLTKLVVIQGKSKIELDLSILFNVTNSDFIPSLESKP